jgi:hypothetical protein
MTENGSMKLTRHETDLKGFTFIKPETHIELFKHCANGLTAVHEHEFKQAVKPLLMAHGVSEFTIL